MEGGLYRFRFRARNVNGWSAWSPIAYIKAANAPARPGPPKLNSVDATAISVSLTRTLDDGGSNVLGYELWRNQGTGTADFVKVSTYLGQAPTHTLTVAADSIVAGQVYTLKTRA